MQHPASLKDALVLTRTRMEKTVEDFRRELSHLRTGRASVTLLDDVKVDYYGAATPVDQGGQPAPPPPPLTLLPPRNIRRDSKEAIEALFKEKKISEDDKHHGVTDLDKLTHDYTEKLDSLSKAKEKEILEL